MGDIYLSCLISGIYDLLLGGQLQQQHQLSKWNASISLFCFFFAHEIHHNRLCMRPLSSNKIDYDISGNEIS
jgi:hypothetical protein